MSVQPTPAKFTRRETVLTWTAAVAALAIVGLASIPQMLSGLWILIGGIPGALFFIIVGRRRRLFLTSLFSLVLFFGALISTFLYRLLDPPPSVDWFLTGDAVFGLSVMFFIVVVAPIGVAWLVTRFFQLTES